MTSLASSSLNPKRLTPTEAKAAVISRGATSRPSGEPSPTVMICNRAWLTVSKNGKPASGFLTTALMLGCGLP